MYRKGLGVSVNAEKAIYYYQKVAKEDSLLGMLEIANIHRDSENYQLSIEFYLKAAAQNSGWAWFNLGLFFDKGCGFNEDKKAAQFYYGKAMECKDEYANSAAEKALEGITGIKKNKTNKKVEIDFGNLLLDPRFKF